MDLELGLKKCAALRCQRIGCNETFTEDDNPDGACRYHESGPFFHDGMKEWSCCKMKSHDFSLFLAIPGCKTGKHTTEKPLTKVAATSQKPAPVVSPNKKANDSCQRCRQGFFCSDHGSLAKPLKPASHTETTPAPVPDLVPVPAPVKKIVDLNEIQTCRNKGCGKSFKEKENHETACEYHPGPAVFHDRMRGWKCCDIHVKEFDEFMEIPPCTKGWHNGGKNRKKKTSDITNTK